MPKTATIYLSDIPAHCWHEQPICAPILPCFQQGLPPRRIATPSRALLPHVFTLTPCKKQEAVIFCGTFRGLAPPCVELLLRRCCVREKSGLSSTAKGCCDCLLTPGEKIQRIFLFIIYHPIFPLYRILLSPATAFQANPRLPGTLQA